MKSSSVTITRFTGGAGSVTIPETLAGWPVTTIGRAAFQSAPLTSVTIPDNVTVIHDYAFEDCQLLSSIAIPRNVTSIGSGVFHLCRTLGAIVVDARNPSFRDEDGVLFDKSETTLHQYPPGRSGGYEIPAGVRTIAESAFSDCHFLTALGFPNTVTNIGNSAFNGCLNLTGVSLPDSVVNVGDQAFHSCYKLASLTIPEGVIRIGRQAFDTCGLTDVAIPASVDSIGSSAFGGFTSVKVITVADANPFFSSLDGVLFDKARTVLLQYPGDKAGNYTVPPTVTRIASEAFRNSQRLTGVTIPAGVTSIGDYAFDFCQALTRIAILTNTIAIGEYAFSNCGVLKAVYFAGQPPSLAGRNVLFTSNNAKVQSMPRILSGSFSFDTREGQFGFALIGPAGTVVVVETSADSANPVWSPLRTNTLTSTAAPFLDPEVAGHARRFYRLQIP